MDFSKNDYEKMMHFMNSTYPTSSNISETVQSFLSDLFQLHHSLFWLADNHSNMYNLKFFNYDDKLIWDYTETYKNQDIMHPKKQLNHIANKRESVLKIDETTTFSSFVKSEYYHFFKRHQMIDQMVIYFTKNKSIYGGIGFSRFKGDKPFTHKDKQILQALSIHLQHVVKHSMVMKEYEAENYFLKRMKSDELGIIQVNENQNISFYNEVAQKIIETIYPDTSVEEFFQTSLTSYLPEGESPIHISINGWKMKIMLQKKRYSISKNYSIYLYPQEKKDKNDDLRTLLSKRELEIFDFVLKGYTNEQIANELWISINTVKKHLQNMYEKTEVSNRTSLIFKLKELENA
ncbi:response regulator transcription factor [Pseudogracilibacillus auburnensis]|uniref:Regulatory LuxR family protein n=1 Tax=Pseudogracilibacillus auburnensis TaxID=1494959 RepID=A0A2V3WB60_9BACI|nr:helix-turn-helix transcriptional regulator [Pseudogracilibacillus auburnensis]PXW85979.1 regulatory LuxR family protein [Pseudogracilibacillus auburnensis]